MELMAKPTSSAFSEWTVNALGLSFGIVKRPFEMV